MWIPNPNQHDIALWRIHYSSIHLPVTCRMFFLFLKVTNYSHIAAQNFPAFFFFSQFTFSSIAVGHTHVDLWYRKDVGHFRRASATRPDPSVRGCGWSASLVSYTCVVTLGVQSALLMHTSTIPPHPSSIRGDRYCAVLKHLRDCNWACRRVPPTVSYLRTSRKKVAHASCSLHP